jgi:hypothetical protein
VPVGIPDTLLGACVGRTVDRIVSHPLFDGGDLLIQRLGYASPTSASPVITFRDEVAELDLRSSILGRS